MKRPLPPGHEQGSGGSEEEVPAPKRQKLDESAGIVLSAAAPVAAGEQAALEEGAHAKAGGFIEVNQQGSALQGPPLHSAEKTSEEPLSAKGTVPLCPPEDINRPKKLLVVGDGNFSFSLSLVQSGKISPADLTTTVLETEEEFQKRYGIEAWNRYPQKLVELGVKVVYGIDATCLTKYGLGVFQQVRWNFPHPIDHTSANRREGGARSLLQDFLSSVKMVLVSGDDAVGGDDCGTVVIVLVYGQWEQWGMQKMLRQQGSFQSRNTSEVIDLNNYPGYVPANGNHLQNKKPTRFNATAGRVFILDRKTHLGTAVYNGQNPSKSRAASQL